MSNPILLNELSLVFHETPHHCYSNGGNCLAGLASKKPLGHAECSDNQPALLWSLTAHYWLTERRLSWIIRAEWVHERAIRQDKRRVDSMEQCWFVQRSAPTRPNLASLHIIWEIWKWVSFAFMFFPRNIDSTGVWLPLPWRITFNFPRLFLRLLEESRIFCIG